MKVYYIFSLDTYILCRVLSDNIFKFSLVMKIKGNYWLKHSACLLDSLLDTFSFILPCFGFTSNVDEGTRKGM